VSLGLVFVFLLHLAPVLVDVDAVDALGVQLGVVLSLLVALAHLESRELLDGVGDVQAGVDCTLHGAEDLVAGGDAGDADVQEGSERLAQVVLSLLLESFVLLHDVVRLAVGGRVALLDRGEVLLGDESSAQEEAGQLGCGLVLEASLKSVLLELEGVGLLQDAVAGQGGPHDLADDSLVGQAHHHSVARSVLFVFYLFDQPQSFVEIRFTFSPSPSGNLHS